MYDNISFLNILAFFLITIAYSLDSQATKYIGIILMLVALIFAFYMLFKVREVFLCYFHRAGFDLFLFYSLSNE